MSKIIEGNEKIKRIQIESSMTLGVGFNEDEDTGVIKTIATAGACEGAFSLFVSLSASLFVN